MSAKKAFHQKSQNLNIDFHDKGNKKARARVYLYERSMGTSDIAGNQLKYKLSLSLGGGGVFFIKKTSKLY